jgi:hypothetical protein
MSKVGKALEYFLMKVKTKNDIIKREDRQT